MTENERDKLRREYGVRLLSAKIRKNHPGKTSTYTVRYFTRETETVALF